MKPSEELQLKYDKLELRKREIEFKIEETKNQILAEREIEEKEQSPAEKWLGRVVRYHNLPENEKEIAYSFATEAHEAGQKHGAGVERERVRPLMDRVKYFCEKINPNVVVPQGIQNWIEYFTVALADYQRGYTITGPDLELPEKPSWAEPTRAKFRCFQCGHPLTPIKD